MKALSDAKQAQMNRMIADAFKFEHTGRERHSPMTILRKLTRIQGFNPPPQPSPERPPIPGSSQWKKLTPKSARTRHISIPGEQGNNNPFLANSTATATAARTPTSNGSGRTPLGRQSTMSNVAAATAQQLAFVRYREENPFLDPEDFYQRWEDEESEVARLNQQSFRTSFGFGTGMAQDESLLEMDGDTGNFSLGQADMSNPLVDPADLGNRSRHIDDITLMSDSAFRNEGKEQGVRQDRGPEIDHEIEHSKDQHGQPPIDELEEMDQGMDLEQDPESLEADTALNSTEEVQQDVLEVEMEEQEEVEPEQLEVTEEEEEEVEEERMEQERQGAPEQETGEEEQDQIDQETQDISEKEEKEKAEDDHEDEPSQDQPDPFVEAEQEAFDQDLEAEAFAAQMEEDEAAELAEMEAAKVAQMEEDKAEAAALEAAKVTQMEEDAAEAAESEAARVAQLKELLDLEGHDLLGENDLIISPEQQDSPITLQQSAEMDEGHGKDIILEHPTDVDTLLHTNINDDTNMGELKSPDAREQSPTLEEQEHQEHEDGYMNVHEEDHIEQQEHEEQHDEPGTQYFDDFPSELGMMSNGEFLPVSQPTTKKSARISQEAMQVILEGSNLFFEQAANDLAAYANHAGRRTIDESDVECLMQRLRITNDRVNVESLLQRYLPRELRDLVLYPSDIRQFRRR
ncbi:hypothetical protein BGZ81_001698 [Podila clonocystis]|nr:hypothetical protein BGZ81_001698 [Podila clonocystis]